MTDTDKEKLIRQYAAGEITWHACASAALTITCKCSARLASSACGPPVAAMEGPNVEARQRGRAVIREALRAAK